MNNFLYFPRIYKLDSRLMPYIYLAFKRIGLELVVFSHLTPMVCDYPLHSESEESEALFLFLTLDQVA